MIIALEIGSNTQRDKRYFYVISLTKRIKDFKKICEKLLERNFKAKICNSKNVRS